jgi:hypothetical protein
MKTLMNTDPSEVINDEDGEEISSSTTLSPPSVQGPYKFRKFGLGHGWSRRRRRGTRQFGKESLLLFWNRQPAPCLVRQGNQIDDTQLRLGDGQVGTR